MQRQLGVLVDVVLSWVLHEFAADWFDVIGQGGAEHHHLLLLRGGTEDFLDVAAHILISSAPLAWMEVKYGLQQAKLTNLIEHLVALIQDEDTDATQAQELVANQSVKSARGTDNDVRVGLLVLEDLGILLDGSTTVEHASLDVGHVLGESVVLIANLECQLAGVAHDQNGAFAGDRLHLLQSGKDENSGLSKTRLRLANDITTEESLGNTCLLDCTIDPMLENGLARFETYEDGEGVEGSVHRRSNFFFARVQIQYRRVSHRSEATPSGRKQKP